MTSRRTRSWTSTEVSYRNPIEKVLGPAAIFGHAFADIDEAEADVARSKVLDAVGDRLGDDEAEVR